LVVVALGRRRIVATGSLSSYNCIVGGKQAHVVVTSSQQLQATAHNTRRGTLSRVVSCESVLLFSLYKSTYNDTGHAHTKALLTQNCEHVECVLL
jgi:hypothetical protein